MKRTILLLVALICLLVSGCSDAKQDQIEHKKRSLEAWQVCIDKGGVPIQSWHSEYVLGDCKFKN
jgi:protein involved in sex pheromone biosynthesis